MIELTGSLWADGLYFGEGPRWHESHLYVSDMHGDEVLRFSADGVRESIVSVANRPSGLGWLPDGQMLIVSMLDRKLMRFDGQALHVHADLSGYAPNQCNDMVVDKHGRAYVGHFGFDLDAGATPCPASIIRVDPDGSSRVVAEDLLFPNGSVVTPDGKTLIVGESFGARLSAFDVDSNGNLSNRRIWATLSSGAVPDGICLDDDGGIWVASPSTNECIRLIEGGDVTHRVATDRGAFACMLGADKQLYILTSAESGPEMCRREPKSQIISALAPFNRAGRP